jgi:hypothetical protein
MRKAAILGVVVLAVAAAVATAHAQVQNRSGVNFMAGASARDLTFTRVDTGAAFHEPSSVFRPPRLLSSFDVKSLFRKVSFPFTLPQTYPNPSFPNKSSDFPTMKVITSTTR